MIMTSRSFKMHVMLFNFIYIYTHICIDIHTYNGTHIVRSHSNGNQQGVPGRGHEVIVNGSLREMKTETKTRSA